MKKRNKFLLQIVVIALLSFNIQSCGNKPIFEENKEFDAYKWPFNKPLTFSVNITDTNSYCNLYVNFRVNANYKYSNIFVWVNETMPDKTVEKKRLEFILADEKGNWLGKNISSIYTYQFQYKPRVKYKQIGIYSYQIEQNMRDDMLENVVSAGLRVEPWTQNTKAW
jgi:gliding motility-associated lipoprotein GldH